MRLHACVHTVCVHVCVRLCVWVWDRERMSVRERVRQRDRERQRERHTELAREWRRKFRALCAAVCVTVCCHGDVKQLSHKPSRFSCHMTSHSKPPEDADLYVSQHSPPHHSLVCQHHYQAVVYASTYRVNNSQISWLIPVPTGLTTDRYHG